MPKTKPRSNTPARARRAATTVTAAPNIMTRKWKYLTSVSQVITAFGGLEAVSEWCRAKPEQVKCWKRWGFIPHALHWRMEKELFSRGYQVAPSVFGV